MYNLNHAKLWYLAPFSFMHITFANIMKGWCHIFLKCYLFCQQPGEKKKMGANKDLQKGSDLQNPLFLREAIKMEIWACIKIQSRIMTELMEAALTSVICKRDQTHLSVRTT